MPAQPYWYTQRNGCKWTNDVGTKVSVTTHWVTTTVPIGDYTFFDDDTISLLTEDGKTKDDLNLPHIVIQGTATEEDNKISAEIKSELEKGDKTVLVIVQGACAMEKIVGVKLT